MGGALLFPFANRLVGPVTVDKNSGDHIVTATWHGRSVPVIANWHGKTAGRSMVRHAWANAGSEGGPCFHQVRYRYRRGDSGL